MANCGFFSQLCTSFACGEKDADKVNFLSIDSFENYLVQRGATELHVFGAYPTACRS